MRVNNLENTNRHFTKRMGNFSVLEYDKDLSVNFLNAESEYFSSKMGVHRRQLVIDKWEAAEAAASAAVGFQKTFDNFD